ncbi:class I SAM-dependent methyltransferase [Microgenomates group bacterium]|nr:class I SAM-dependent methyltransferase [Microgenomates group bacterium]
MRHFWLEKFISRFPHVYWQLKAGSFLKDSWQKRLFPQHQWLLQTIQTLQPHSILEVGCGFGRNLKFLTDNGIIANRLTGVDISSVLLAQARLSKSVRLIRANVLSLPFSSHSFDLVFTHGLLMHLNPRQLPRALTELTRVSKKHLILIEEIRSRPRQLNYFTWAHDYEKMIANLPVETKFVYTDQKLKLRYMHLQKNLQGPTS